MVLELFLDLYSPPCRAIYIFAKKNAIPFELQAVTLAQGEQGTGSNQEDAQGILGVTT